MSYGVPVNEAVPTGTDHYLARQVPMGIEGHWQVEVRVTRPGQPIVAAAFVVEVSGP